MKKIYVKRNLGEIELTGSFEEVIKNLDSFINNYPDHKNFTITEEWEDYETFEFNVIAESLENDIEFKIREKKLKKKKELEDKKKTENQYKNRLNSIV